MDPEGSLTGSIAAKDSATSSLTKELASKAPPKTADHRRGQLSVAECGHKRLHATGVADNPRISGTSSRTKSFQLCLARLPRQSGLQAFSAENRATTDKVKEIPPSGTYQPPGLIVSGQEGGGPEGNHLLRSHGAASISPPGGVLRPMPSSTRSACLTSSGLP